MAETTLDILLRVRNQTGAVLSQVSSDLSKIRTALASTSQNTKQTNSDFQRLFSTLASGKGEIQGVVSGFQGLVASLGGLVLVNQIKGLADVAARTQVLGTVLNEIGRASGFSRAEIEKFDAAVQKAGITAGASRQTLTQFLQAGLDPAKAAELARAAQNFAVVTGENSSAALSRLVTNIQQIDVTGLKFQGIIVDMTKVTADFAREVGKTPQELTRAEQQTALLNEVLRKGKESGQLYVAAMGDVGKAVGSLSRLQEELQNSLGEKLLPAYKALVDEFGVFLKQAKLVSDSVDANGTAAEAFGESVRASARSLREFALLLVEYSGVVTTFVQALLGFAALRAVALVFTFITSQLAFLGRALATAGTAIGIFARGFSFLTALVSGGTLALSAPFLLVLGAIGAAAVAVGAFALQFEPVARIANIALASISLAYNRLIGDSEGAAAASDALFNAVTRAGDGTEARAAAAAKLIEVTREQVELQTTLIDLENALVQANKTGTAEQQKTAKAAFDAAKKQNEDLNAQRVALARAGDVSGATQELIQKKEEEAAAIRKIEIALAKVSDAGIKAREELGIPAGLGDSLRADVITAEFGKAAGAFKNLVASFDADQKVYAANVKKFQADLEKEGVAPTEALVQATQKARDAVRFSVNDLRIGVQSIADAAKAPDEIAAAIDLIVNAAGRAVTSVDELKRTLEFRLEAESLRRVEQNMQGYSEATKEAQTALTLLRTVTDDQARATLDLSQAYADVGVSAGRVFENLSFAGRSGIRSLVDGFTGLRSTVAETSRIVDQGTRQQLASANGTFQESLRLLADSERRKRELAQQTVGGSQTFAAALRAIEEQSVRERVTINQTYYSRLKELRDNALSQFKTFANTIKGLDEEIFQNGVNREKSLRDLKRQGLTEEQQFADRLLEIDQLAGAERLAISNKQFDLAKQLNQQRIQAASQLANSGGVPQEVALARATEATNKAYTDRDSLLRGIRTETDKAARTQLQTYEELGKEIGKVAETLAGLAGEQLAKVKFEVGAGETEKLLAALQQQFDRNPLRVTFQGQVNGQTTTVQRFASGGGVQGSGTDTSDNIPAWLSPGEWVSRAKAVRYYGAEVFRRLNNMTLPRSALRLATGGLVPAGVGMPVFGGSSRGPSEGGETTNTPRRDIVDVNLNIGGRRVSLYGERQQATALVDALAQTKV